MSGSSLSTSGPDRDPLARVVLLYAQVVCNTQWLPFPGTPGVTRWCRTTPAPSAEASPSAPRPGIRNRIQVRRWTRLPCQGRENNTGRAASSSATP